MKTAFAGFETSKPPDDSAANTGAPRVGRDDQTAGSDGAGGWRRVGAMDGLPKAVELSRY